MTGAEILATAKAQGIDIFNKVERKPVSDAIHRAVQQYNQEIRAAVGEEAYKKFVKFQLLAPDVAIVKQLSGRLSSQDALTHAQRDRLITILNEAKNAKGLKRSVSILDERGVPTSVRIILDSALAEARTFLSPEQHARLVEISVEQRRDPVMVPPGW